MRSEAVLSDSIVSIQHVDKWYGNNHVVKDMNLEIREGEFLTLLGPSGCGKTTTLRMIAGFEDASSGIIEVQGERVEEKEPYQRDVNTVFQNYSLFPHMSVYDNVAYGPSIKKVPKDEIRRRVEEMLALVQMSGYEKRKPDALSGGQKQRVAIARALINNPRVLLLDEPLGALDLKLRKQMQIELKRLQKKLGITFVYVTHDQEEAMTMSDRIAVMRDGIILQIDSPLEIYDHPNCRFVADFIGESNILNGTMIRDRRVSFIGHEFDCVDEGFGEDVPVDVVVRPEDIYFTKKEEKTQFTATVKSCTFKGVHYEMFVDSDTGNELMIQDYDPYPVGSTVRLYIDPDDIQVMKKERTCNTLYGTVKDEETITLLDADFPLPNKFEAGTEVKVEVPFGAIDLMDNLDDGVIDGEVHFILYKGDHYHLTIKTEDGDFLWVDTDDIWDKGDLVGIQFKSRKGIKITKKDE